MSQQRRASFQPQLRRKVLHNSDAGELFVTKVSLLALLNQWKEHHLNKKLLRSDDYFIECNMNGHVTWPKAKVFTSSELVGRNNVKIISFEQ